MKTWLQHIPFLSYDQQQVITYGNPYLCEDGIHGGAIEGFYVKMLLYPFEEQFDLPSFSIQFGNRQSLQLEVIRQKPINDSGAKIFIDNESECVRILVGGYCSRQSYSLVRDKSCIRVNLSALQNLIYHIILCPGNKVGVVEMKVLVERIKPHIALVHQIVRVGFHRNFVHNFRIVNSSMSKIDECRDRASEIHQRMHFNGTFAMRKVAHGQSLRHNSMVLLSKA